jgi:type II secretory pathway pseudopilin PulG
MKTETKDSSPLASPSASRRHSRAGLTLFELIFLLGVLAVLAAVALPVMKSTQAKGTKVKELSNAKQIALALRLYAADNDGNYPTYTLHDGKPTKKVVPDSNTAFAQLFPTYVEEETIFWMSKSAFCSPKPPDNVIDKDGPLDTPVETLKKGENEWAYVVGLNDSSNPAVPLIADGFTDPKAHTYSKDPMARGGVWKGQVAIVINADSSGNFENIDPATMTVVGPNGGGNKKGDIFSTAHKANGWLAPENVVVNPK